MTTYTVTANHVSDNWKLDKATVEVKSNDGGKTFYCYIPKFGCSKSYTMPKTSIYALLQDNGCFDIKIIEDFDI